MTSASRAFLAAAAALLFSAFAAAQLPVPALSARVTDQTGTLGTEQRAALEQKLAAFEAKKGSQVAVLIVPTTQPEAIEQFSIRVVEQWKLGRKGVDDGVLLLVAKDDRQLRIEVGRGLEGALPDAIAKRIVAEYITPRFKQGDYYGGILAGIDRILGTIEGEPLPAPREARLPGGVQFDWFELLVIAIIGISVVNGILRAMFGRFGAAALVGGAVGLLVWIFWTAAFIAVIGGLLAFVLSLVGGVGRGRHWSSGGGGGWSSGGGGGFSGGGGGFSGGGASGRW
ncbi:MAG: YgcG family protein [Betaproteobacteria bacterium]|nr:MAG: YgcG family protein [Betaproteobacteria bacterium]